MIITFGDYAYTYNNAVITEETFNGAARSMLTVMLPENAAGLDELHSALTEANCQTIWMEDTETSTRNSYDGYVLRVKLSIEPIVMTPESASAPAVTENMIVIKLGKRTYIEEQLRRLGL